MLEWSSVPETKFTSPNGTETNVKLVHEHVQYTPLYEIQVHGEDLELIAYEELGSSLEAMKLLEANATILSEYMFDMSKIKKLKIPE